MLDMHVLLERSTCVPPYYYKHLGTYLGVGAHLVDYSNNLVKEGPLPMHLTLGSDRGVD